MKQLADLGFSGILADDMGLGKTIQVITYIKNHLKNNEKTTINNNIFIPAKRLRTVERC